jgi:hypothetical protein
MNQHMINQYQKLCGSNTYTTTLHAINSAIVKLGKVSAALTVYRGVSDGALPDAFWEPNEFDSCGAVEYAFMSTTVDEKVAMDYANKGRTGIVFEIPMGMVDRGANFQWLSQYPHEAEVTFAPLTGLEVLRTRVEGPVIVITLRLNINLNALTLSQVIGKYKKLMSDMCCTVRVDFKHGISSKGASLSTRQIETMMNMFDAISDSLAGRPSEFYNEGSNLRNTLDALFDILPHVKSWGASLGTGSLDFKACSDPAVIDSLGYAVNLFQPTSVTFEGAGARAISTDSKRLKLIVSPFGDF